MKGARGSRERARARPGFDAVMSRTFYDPFWRPGWRRLARRKALQVTERVVRRVASSRTGVGGRLAWQELSLKLRTFALFSLLDWIPSLRAAGEITLPVLVSRAQSLDPDEVPWVMEGIGQYVTQRLLAGDALPVDMLQGEELPPWSLSTLHTGLGISLAVWLLAAVDANDPDQTVARNVERFVSLCERCSRPGYTGMAIECLGFVLRFLHPQHLAPADAFLQENRRDLLAPLWHGAGRALYFLPGNLIPGRSAPWRAFTMAEREAPHEIGRQNLLAGLAWPFLLVTWRQPRILEAVLSHHEERLHSDDCFSTGLGAAMVVWVESIPGESRITELLNHRPHPGTPELAAAWEALVRKPCVHALTQTYPLLKKEHRLDELFRYPLPGC
jgi:hypothetical protein